MPDIQLKNFANIAALENADLFYCHDNNEDKEGKATGTVVKAYVLGGASIGGNSAGDILTTNGAQIVTGKRLNSPTINSDVAITATGADLNAVSGITASRLLVSDGSGRVSASAVTATEAGRLSGVTSAIQTQINDLSASIVSADYRPHLYRLEWSNGAGVTTKSITQATILTALGLSGTAWVIDHTSLNAMLTLENAGTYAPVLLNGGSEAIEWTTQTIDLQKQLDQINISGMSAEKTYAISVMLMVVAKAGT